MITTGIIREINISSDNEHQNNLYGVELSIFKTPVNQNNMKDFIVKCPASVPGGFYNSYEIGDAVYIGFVNNSLANPIILGKIYKGNSNISPESYLSIKDLKVSNSTNLPENTAIGDINYDTLHRLRVISDYISVIEDGQIIIGSAAGLPVSSGYSVDNFVLKSSCINFIELEINSDQYINDNSNSNCKVIQITAEQSDRILNNNYSSIKLNLNKIQDIDVDYLYLQINDYKTHILHEKGYNNLISFDFENLDYNFNNYPNYIMAQSVTIKSVIYDNVQNKIFILN